ncbi:MAG: DAK2 domain-containing protein [Bacillota bacterium]
MRHNINGTQLKNMIISGANNLENHKNMVNSLNVYPVPDGDTGTNMSLTMTSAVKELKELKAEDIHSVFEAAANGTLMGARGNSGVILSQIFRGFSRGIKPVEELDSVTLAKAFIEGSNTAYKAIMKPTEGTMLTVIREAAEYAVKIAESCTSTLVLLEQIIEKANEVLDKTPEMLPVLKSAGVVDAGGRGLICILEGMYIYQKTGIMIEVHASEEDDEQPVSAFAGYENEIEFGYCTEFFIKSKRADIDNLKMNFELMGDSLLIVGDEKLVKVHIHTNNPGRVLEIAMEQGELSKIKIDNMREQHRELLISEKEKAELEKPVEEPEEFKKYAVITVAMGDGISNIFRDIGADVIIEGGQTMNPSTEDMVKSINKLNAENIIILPNNSNIILAANQAKSLTDKNVLVAPTKTIPQGIAALMALDTEKSPDDNIKKIEKAIKGVSTGLITYAVRSSNYDGINIEEGNILGLVEGKIKDVGHSITNVSRNVINEMINEDSSLISIYYGNELNEEEAQEFCNYVQDAYPDCEIDMHYGGQPLYYYILSVE